MATFFFNQLEILLSNLEDVWRSLATHSSQPSQVRPHHNEQYFGLMDDTRGVAERLPVVILVGINYTQGTQKIPDELGIGTPGCSCAVADILPKNLRPRLAAAHAAMCGNHRTWVDHCRAPDFPKPAGWPRDYHLILTNLSPWITKLSWQSQMCAPSVAIGADLLSKPPYRPAHVGWPFDHLEGLLQKLNSPEAWWIGHGVNAVWPRWHLVNSRLGVQNWMLIRNPFFGNFTP